WFVSHAPAQERPAVPAPPPPPTTRPATPAPEPPAVPQPPDRARELPAEPERTTRGSGAALMLRHVILDDVNAEKRTISGLVDGGPGRTTTGEPTQKLVGLPVAGDAVIHIGNKPGPLTALKR